MANKFAENVKRIVGEQRDTTVTPSLDERGGIESTRGIGSQTPGGKVTSQAGAVGDSAQKDQDGKTDNTTKTETQTNGTTSSPGGIYGGGSGGYTKDAGKFAAKDLIDGTDGPTLKTSNTDNYTTTGTPIIGNSLKAITATDCDSGKDLTLRLDGLYEPVDATTFSDGTPKTAAWTDPTTPPTKVGYEAGSYWTNLTYLLEADTLSDIAQAYEAVLQSLPTAPYVFVSLTEISPTTTQGRWERVATGVPVTDNFVKTSCSGTPPVDSSLCPIDPPTETNWGEDNTILLTREDGKFAASEYDPDATVSYTGQQTSFVNICMDGGRTGVVRAGRDGGTVVYETSGGNPTGNVYYYDSDGALAGIGDSTSINNFLPRSSD